jgi:hypothetical protein
VSHDPWEQREREREKRRSTARARAASMDPLEWASENARALGLLFGLLLLLLAGFFEASWQSVAAPCFFYLLR